MKQLIVKKLIKLTQRIVDTNQGKFATVPDSVIALSVFMAINAIIQAVADVVIEALSMAQLIVSMPLRLEFLFLAIISSILGIFTLNGLKRKEIDVTRNSLRLSFLVEVFLVVGDVYFLLFDESVNMTVFWIRFPFMLFTTINVGIVSYIVWRMHVFRRRRYPLKF